MLAEALQAPSAKSVVSTLAAVAATAVIVRSVLRDYLPPELQHFVASKLRAFLVRSLSSQLTLVINEFDDDVLSPNDIFRAARLYLKPTLSPQTTRFRATLPRKETNVAITMERNQEIVDFFCGVRLTWKLVSSDRPEKKSLELSFHRKHKYMVLEKYLPYVLEKSKEVKEENKTLKLFTLKQSHIWYHGARGRMREELWESVILDHPSTFDTMAMEAEAKRAVMEDLERFVKRREFYRSVGRAWKRGYLLFGPPGTGKSSLVAAMANYLNFNVFDLELSSVRSNVELRKLVLSTENRSVLVVEDVDCAGELRNRVGRVRTSRGHFWQEDQRSEVTLSGLLNFIDGLWSSCGDERIIVLTTNYKDRLDPALLRPGRMDMHVHLTYCTPCGFRMLASNYLGVTEHRLFSEIEQLLETTEVTPAEIAEELLKIEEPEDSLRGLIEFLKRKKGNETQSSK